MRGAGPRGCLIESSKEGPNILRLKGLINLVGLDHPVAIHAVHHNLYPLEQLPAWPGEDRRSRIVIIAEGAGGCAIAAALSPEVRAAGHKRIVVVVSGGNIDLSRFAQLVGACA